MTGWGQDGPYAAWSGHDINYIALAGCAGPHRPGRRRRPCRRSTSSATSAAAACCSPSASSAASSKRSKAAQGQVIDAAMVDGAAVLMTMFHAFRAIGHVDEDTRGTNLLDTGAHFYDVYRLRRRQVHLDRLDRAAVLRRAAAAHRPAATTPEFADQMDRDQWPALKGRLEVLFHQKTRDEWCAHHGAHRRVLRPRAHHERGRRPIRTTRPGTPSSRSAAIVQPAPAPRFSRTHGRDRSARLPIAGQHTARSSPTGGSCRPRSPSCSRRARSSSNVATAVFFHAHPDDEALTTGGTMARAAARGPSCRSRRGHRRAARRGARTTSATARRSLDRRRAETERSARCARRSGRVDWLGYHDSGMHGWDQNDEPDSFLQAPTSTRPRAARGDPREEGAEVLTTYDWHGNYGHPDHIQVHTVGHARGRAGRRLRTSTRPR